MKLQTAQQHRGLLSACLASGLLLAGCAAQPTTSLGGEAVAGRTDVSALYIVDCLLPGQVRQLGGRTFLSPRRPTRTTASDCRVRGGEYVAYDRADLKSALNVWMSAAEAGDADAQNTVGEIFERGLGGEPNYEAAVIWYTKAAAQGDERALLNLGTLYELGRGVEQDRLKALNLYRQSWGLSEDDLLYRSAADQELEALRQELDGEIQQKNRELQLLQKQIEQLQGDVAHGAAANADLEALLAWQARIKVEQSAAVTARSRLRAPSLQALPTQEFSTSAGLRLRDRNFGRYYALIIGNQNYDRMENLATPLSDAERIANVLQDKYGFTVQLVRDANDVTVLEAINNLNAIVGPDDNLLIYYAGHGSRIGSDGTETGYWLPVNADRPPVDTYWVPTEQITSHMGNFQAKRVLVLADSCYSGVLTSDDPGMRMMLSGDDRVFSSDGFIRRRFDKRSRLMVSSGGDRPVLDVGGSGNSVFARAFIDELEANNGLMTTPSLFLRLRDRVVTAAAEQDYSQEPEIKALRRAGHEVGDFFFVPRSLVLAESDQTGD
ncbi:MAG: caspase family protein [Pseudomonadota bacterium]